MNQRDKAPRVLLPYIASHYYFAAGTVYHKDFFILNYCLGPQEFFQCDTKFLQECVR